MKTVELLLLFPLCVTMWRGVLYWPVCLSTAEWSDGGGECGDVEPEDPGQQPPRDVTGGDAARHDATSSQGQEPEKRHDQVADLFEGESRLRMVRGAYARAQEHTHTHIHTLTLEHTRAHTHTHALILHTVTHTYTHTHRNTTTLPHTYTDTVTHTHSHSHTHTVTHPHCHTVTHAWTHRVTHTATHTHV